MGYRTTRRQMKATASKTVLLDVIEVELKAPHKIRVMDTGKTERNAEAVVNMAVMRRGVENHFFTTAPAGKFKDGDCLPQSKD